MADTSKALIFTNDADGKTLTAEQVRSFIVNSYDTEGLRTVAYSLLEAMGRMHGRQIEYQAKMRSLASELEERVQHLQAARDTAVRSAPTVVIEPGAVVLTVPAPTFTFEAGALAVQTEAPRTGATVEYDDKGRVIGVTPKPAA